MHRMGFLALTTAIAVFSSSMIGRAEDKADDQNWTTIKGRIVFDGTAVPKQTPIAAASAHPDKATCLKDGGPKSESWVIDPETKGVRDVFVWLAPDQKNRIAPFPQAKIHPSLAKLNAADITIKQPCCKFIPHATMAREGQNLIIDGSPTIAHNAKWDSSNNGEGNPIIPAGGSYTLPKPLKAEPSPINFSCSIHPWMKTSVKVVDHPYYAVTNEKGEFTIPLAPVGKFRLFIQHPDNGYLNGREGAFGQTMEIKPGGMDLGTIKMKENK